ncbi:MAG: hypothetical protein WB699_03905 [Bacteroidota bacterium]
MTTFRYFARGCAASWNFRAIAAVLYLATTALALLPALSLRSVLNSSFGPSAATLDLARGFDFTVLGDLMRNHGKEITASLAALFPTMLLSMFVNLFFAGGIIAAAQSGEVTVREFFRNSARYAGRFVRLEVIAVALGLLLMVGLTVGSSLLLDALTTHEMSEWPTVWALLIDGLVIALAMFVLSLVIDYARIALVVEAETSAWKGFRRALVFLFSAKFITTFLSILFLIALGILFALFLGLSSLADSPGSVALIVTVFFQQAFVIGRVLLRVASFTAETTLYQEYSSVPVNVPIVDEGGGVPGTVEGTATS